jgi:hypothetical protein
LPPLALRVTTESLVNTPATIALALSAALASAARADDPPSDEALEAISSAGASTAVAVDHSWLYNDPTRIAAPGRAIGSMRFTYGSGSPTRAFAGNTSTSGALLEAGGEVGLTGGLSAVAIGAQGEDASGAAQTGAMLGLRWSLLPRSVRATQLVVSGGFLRELQGNSGAWGRISLGHDAGPARLALSVHGERIFTAARDSLDLMVTAGATVRLLENVRAGIEYVGQDLEGVVGGDSEGGARHLAGPVVSAALWNQRVSIAGGPAVALGQGQSRLVGRIGAACQF